MIKILFIAGEIENQKYIDEMIKINLQQSKNQDAEINK
jgi:hypothetical protein